jgi:hypothetical protein
MWVAWVATALGVLTKGLVAAVVPAAVLLLYSLCTRDFAPWRRLQVSIGLPIFLIITLPWHWAAARRLPGFLQFFFVHEHLSRYLTPSADRQESWWFFGAVFVLGSIPWTLSALRVMAFGWRRRSARGQFDPAFFLWLWAVFIIVFFSLSDSKLIPYILPALPAVALLMAAAPAAALRRDVTLTAAVTLVAALACAMASWYGPHLISAGERSLYFVRLAKPLGLVAALLAVSGLLVLLQRRRGSTHAAVFLGAGWCLAGMLLMRAAAAVAPVYSGVGLARAFPMMPPAVPLYTVGTYDQTLPFYWQRTLELVAYRGELDFGLRQDPGRALAVADFVDRWQNAPQAYAVMEIKMFDELKVRGLPMSEVARDLRRVLVRR